MALLERPKAASARQPLLIAARDRPTPHAETFFSGIPSACAAATEPSEHEPKLSTNGSMAPAQEMYKGFVGLPTTVSNGVPLPLVAKSWSPADSQECAGSDAFTLARVAVAEHDLWLEDSAKSSDERNVRLAKLRASAQIADVVRLLGSPEAEARERAVGALREADAKVVDSGIPVEALLALVKDPSASIRSWAFERLKVRKDDVALHAGEVVALFEHHFDDVRSGALELLLTGKREALSAVTGKALALVLKDPSSLVRARANGLLKAILEFGGPAADAAVVEILQDDGIDIRDVVLQALQKLPSECVNKLSTEVLVHVLQDLSLSVRSWAVAALRTKPDDVAASAVMPLFQHGGSNIRESAVEVLQNMSTASVSKLPEQFLGDLLQDTSWTVRSWAITALRLKGDSVAASVVVPLLQSGCSNVRESAVQALKDTSPKPWKYVPADVLANLLEDTSTSVRDWAAQALEAQSF